MQLLILEFHISRYLSTYSDRLATEIWKTIRLLCRCQHTAIKKRLKFCFWVVIYSNNMNQMELPTIMELWYIFFISDFFSLFLIDAFNGAVPSGNVGWAYVWDVHSNTKKYVRMHAVYILINFFDNNHLVFLKIFYKICILTVKFGCSFCDITLKNLTLDIGRQKKFKWKL